MKKIDNYTKDYYDPTYVRPEDDPLYSSAEERYIQQAGLYTRHPTYYVIVNYYLDQASNGSLFASCKKRQEKKKNDIQEILEYEELQNML